MAGYVYPSLTRGNKRLKPQRASPSSLKEKQTCRSRDVGSRLAGRPGVAFDAKKLGESGQAGVPMGTNIPLMNAITISRKVVEVRILMFPRKGKRFCACTFLLQRYGVVSGGRS